MLLSLEHVVGGFNPTNFIMVIMKTTNINGSNLDPIVIFKKLMSFGADGVNVFQGCDMGVTIYIQY
jgi:hypothetical protein